MADNIQQQLKALATATEHNWMTKEEAGKEFKRLYALLGAGTGGGVPSSSTGGTAPPASSLQQAAAAAAGCYFVWYFIPNKLAIFFT